MTLPSDPAAAETSEPNETSFCERCGQALGPGALACPRCGMFVFRARLEQLSAEATQLEATNPLKAVQVWRECLNLLPLDSQQHQMIVQRANALVGDAIAGAGQASAQVAGTPRRVLSYQTRTDEGRAETVQSIILKTGGSMILSVMLFSRMAGWEFALGLVLLIFVHEMGHVTANWYYGIKQSAPIFLGIFGAVIFIRGQIRSAWEESVMGIAGPVFGSIAALACYGWYLKTGNEMAAILAYYGFFLNLFNLLPLPPLDGGRAAAAISPWLWGLGIVGMAAYIIRDVLSSMNRGGGFSFFWILILFWILSQTLARIRHTLLEGQWRSEYYHVGPGRRIAMTVVYVGLAIVLITCMSRLSAATGISLGL